MSTPVPHELRHAKNIARGKLGAKRRWAPQDDSTTEAQNFRELAVEEYIHKLVNSWPSLRAEQRDRLSILLKGEK